MFKGRPLIAGAGLLLGTAASAQNVDIRAGRLIDPRAAKVLTDQRIRIVDGRIASVAAWRDSDGPAAIDWSGETVLPGLIDLHTHLADGAVDEGDGDPAIPLKRSEARTILKGAKAASIELRSGFTTVRDVGVYRGLGRVWRPGCG
jgi:imidazolonepropionase-like amidohydrolase